MELQDLLGESFNFSFRLLPSSLKSQQASFFWTLMKHAGGLTTPAFPGSRYWRRFFVKL